MATAERRIEAAADKPIAWVFELASFRDKTTGKYGGWREMIQASKPHVPEGSIRNLRPLIAADAASPASEVERLREDCAELYQVIGVMADYCPDDQAIVKALDNASAAANGLPRKHHDLLPFILPTASPASGGEWRTIPIVEAAARAIACHPDGGNITPGSSRLVENVIEEWMDLARAVLLAASAASAALSVTEEEIKKLMVTIPQKEFATASDDYMRGYQSGVNAHMDAVLALIRGERRG